MNSNDTDACDSIDHRTERALTEPLTVLDHDETPVDDDGRPDDCDCSAFHADASLPCWACFRDGFETPAAGDDD